MAEIQIVRINPDGTEGILEVTPIPDGWSCYWFPFQMPNRIRKLEEHYNKTGKPKKSYIDAIYITRRQVERER